MEYILALTDKESGGQSGAQQGISLRLILRLEFRGRTVLFSSTFKLECSHIDLYPC